MSGIKDNRCQNLIFYWDRVTVIRLFKKRFSVAVETIYAKVNNLFGHFYEEKSDIHCKEAIVRREL